MDWRDSGRSFSFLLEFRRDGEPAIPDANSVRVTIRDSNGVVFPGYDNLQVNATLPTATFTIDSVVNNLPDGYLSAFRFLDVSYTVDGEPFSQQYVYSIKPFTPIAVSADTVRAIYGVRASELPSSDIDVYQAYLDLVVAHPEIASFLVSPQQAASANRAIALKAALNVFPSMRIRTLKEEELATANQIRATIDWDSIYAHLEDELNSLLETKLGLTPDFTPTVLFLVVTPTDVITNA